MRHHHQPGNIVSAGAMRMASHNVQTTVSHAELLAQIAEDAFTPQMHARRGSAKGESTSRLLQAITQVVVVAIAERFVQQSGLS